jgi:hypothetical protein
MSAHTPGPWKVVIETRPYLDPSYYVTAVDPDASPDSGYLEVPFHVEAGLDVCIGFAGGNARTFKSGRPEANARLIAAAPDLFAALQAISRAGTLNDQGVIDMMRAALAKATGES